jgi:ABC-type nitrate/sulfonate/bicarbonate transport system substrate-binding protein
VLSQGKGFETQLVEKLQSLTGVPCTTSIVAAMDAFRDLSASRLAVVNPYPPDLNEKMVQYLKSWGFDALSVVSLGTTFTESSAASIGDIYRAAKKAVAQAAMPDAIFIPCANFPVVDVIEQIETDLGLPVIANMTSQLYVAFKAIGMREPINNYGKLLRTVLRWHDRGIRIFATVRGYEKVLSQTWLLILLLIFPVSAGAQKLRRAIVAFGSSGGNLTPFWIGREAGLYRQHGVDADVVIFRGSTIAINALVTKDAQFAGLGASSAVLAKLGGMDTVLIATATPGLLFYLITKKEIKSANDLKGKKIAVSRPGTDSDLAARVAVQRLGLAEKDVAFVSVGADAERVMAMSQNVVDATVVTVAGYVAAQKLGFNTLLDLSQANIPYEAASLITTQTLIRENPELVRRFTRGFVAAIQYAQTTVISR